LQLQGPRQNRSRDPRVACCDLPTLADTGKLMLGHVLQEVFVLLSPWYPGVSGTPALSIRPFAVTSSPWRDRRRRTDKMMLACAQL
jgi:hypothetical protein